jgi:ABC-type antimicrobial peptide transport system permease subunit
VGSTAASKVLSALGDVQRPDAATLLASAAALGIAAMAACAGPARRAIRVDVNAALRDE